MVPVLKSLQSSLIKVAQNPGGDKKEVEQKKKFLQ